MVSHPFEADGAISAERFDGSGGAMGAVRFVESREYREEERAGRMLYTSNASTGARVMNGLTGRGKNTGNTSVWAWRDRIFTLVESALPTEIDPADLSTLGETDLSGLLGNAFSAHPKRVESRRSTINFGVRYGVRSYIDLFELPDEGASRRLGHVPLPWHTVVHDFVVTARYAVFVVGPARLRLARVLLQLPPFEDWFSWQPDLGTQILVVDLADPTKVTQFTTEAFWSWHLANGYEEGDDIVVDYARYEDLSSLRNLGSGAPIDPPTMHRMRLNLTRKSVRTEQLYQHTAEFPRLHPSVEGERHRYLWCMSGTPDGRESIARIDCHSGEAASWLAPLGSYVCEPIVVPRAGTYELDAWILTRVYDMASDHHYTAVLDARAPQLGPVAQVWHDQALPSPFHGIWVGASGR